MAMNGTSILFIHQIPHQKVGHMSKKFLQKDTNPIMYYKDIVLCNP